MSKREKFGTRLLTKENDVFEQNAWDNVEWNEEQILLAKSQIEENSKIKMSIEKSSEFDSKANEFWNKFYEKMSDNFFKERNWLFIDFPELISNCKAAQDKVKFEREFGDKLNLNKDDKLDKNYLINEIDENNKKDYDNKNEKKDNEDENIDDKELRIFELGCGTGSTIRPILQTNTNPKTYVYCSDFSSNAINIFKNHSSFDKNRCHAFVYDCTDTETKLPCEENSIDILIMIFTLSAIHPSKMQSTINNACKYLKPGGCFLFRDYGRYDMAQLRFKQGKCISDNFYVRGDGTFSYFFEEDEIEKLFTEAGLKKEWIYVDRRLQVNRIRQLKMFRVYIQAKFIKT